MAGSDLNADGISGNDLTYVPLADGSDITLQNPVQLDSLNAFIDSQSCLAASRGALLRRNACRNPWSNLVNARLAMNVPLPSGQNLQVSWDVFNVLNLIDGGWGLFNQVSGFEAGGSFLSAVGYDEANNRPIYRFSPPSTITRTIRGPSSSTWRMQFGAKYSF
jgi:hypothetical protein